MTRMQNSAGHYGSFHPEAVAGACSAFGSPALCGEALTDRAPIGLGYDRILPEERAAVLRHALAHPKDGTGGSRGRWSTPTSPISVRPACTGCSKAPICSTAGSEAPRAASLTRSRPAPHERWNTDLMPFRIADAWHFLVSVLDAYSRYVHWEILTTMTAADVRLVVQEARVAADLADLPHAAGDVRDLLAQLMAKDLQNRKAAERHFSWRQTSRSSCLRG